MMMVCDSFEFCVLFHQEIVIRLSLFLLSDTYIAVVSHYITILVLSQPFCCYSC
jgi:hypothetical protein